MSAIFLSHSSADAEAAADWKRWLSEDQHHQSVFLDFDPEAGIPAGRDWEGELYRRLRNCRALIVLCSGASMASRWCFVEITLARSLGKPIFPVRIEPCEVVEVLHSVQIIDVAEGLDTARQRLARALGTAGLQSADRFGWDKASGRSPYPGLLAFDEEDAGVFFGRDFEIGEGLDRLNQMRRYRGSGLLVVLGAAGSGKSSLVRAGLVPRLRQDERWVVLPAFRPGNEPRLQLARVMESGASGGGSFDAERFRTGFVDNDSVEEAAEELNRSMAGLCGDASNAEARVVVVLDQFEELLGQPDDHPAHRFLAVMRAALEREDCVMLVLATMRSDYLGEFQSRPYLRGFAYENLTLGPMDLENLREMIERPAQLADVDLEDGLVDALLSDADTDYALPLLAFTLNELHASHVDANNTITLAAYQDHLGGLEGALTKAVERRLPAVLTEEDRAALQRAFLSMARLDDAGRVTRRAVPWSELEAMMGGRQRAEALLGPFIEGRLLRSGGIQEGERTIEVTHEALFRNWPDLVKWIREHLVDLKFRDQIAEAAAQWVKGGEKTDDLLRHKVRLARAVELRDSERVPMSDELRHYLDESEAFETRRLAAVAWRRRLIVGGALVAALFMSVMWRIAERAERAAQRSEREARAQVSRFLAAETGRQDLDVALLLAIEGYKSANTREARDALVAKVYESPWLVRFLVGHEDWVTTLEAPRGVPLLVSRGQDNKVWIWNAASGEPLDRLADDGRTVNGVALDAAGRYLASTHDDGSATLWELDPDLGSPTPRRGLRPPEGALGHVALSADGRVLAALGQRGVVHLWTTAEGESLPSVAVARAPEVVALDPAGDALFTGHRDGRVQVWSDLRSAPRLAWDFVPSERRGRVTAIAFDIVPGGSRPPRWAWSSEDADGIHVCTTSAWGDFDDSCPGGSASFDWRASSDGSSKGVADLAFDANGHLAAAGLDGAVAIFNRDGNQVSVFRQPQAVYAVAFLADGEELATGSRDGKIRIWSRRNPRRAQVHEAIIDSIAVDTDTERVVVVSTVGTHLRYWERDAALPERSLPVGRFSRVALGRGLVAAGGDNGRVEVWEGDSEAPREALDTTEAVTALDVHPSIDLIAVGQDDGLVGLWNIERDVFDYSFVLGDSVSAVAFSVDGGELAAASWDGSMVVWSLEDGKPVGESRQQLATVGVASLAYSRAGSTLVAGLESGEVLRRDGEGAFAPIEGHPVHADAVLSLAFGPGDGLLASGSTELEVWNLAGGHLEFTLSFPGEGGEIPGLAFAPDGTTLAVARRQTVWHVPLEIDEWIALACERANRELTLEEWSLHVGEQQWRETCAPAEAAGDEDIAELGSQEASG